MPPLHVVVLGAGFGGLELTTRLAEEAPDDVRVTLIDKSDAFVFGFSKLDVMFGHQQLDAVRHRYADIVRPSVTFRQETITAIDPDARRVTTDGGTYDADVLVLALGADYDTAATPGLDEAGIEFYSVPGALRARDAIADLRSGRVLISVLGGFFKCPPAPNEAAFMLHDHLVRAGVRDAVSIHLTSPLPSPIPISPEASEAIAGMLAERGVEYSPSTLVTSLDPATKTAHTADGRSFEFDLLLGIPVHRAPQVVIDGGLTADDGWVSVDPATFATRWPDVYAIGDLTSAPVPRAGVIAEGEATTVADVLLHRIRGGAEPEPFPGRIVCYVESGNDEVAWSDVHFMAEGGPASVWHPASGEGRERKREFGAVRRERWFGHAV
jgi:sulfide:quinone oxidoreductase